MRFSQFLTTESWILVLLAILASFLFPFLGTPFTPIITYLLMGVMFLSLMNVQLRHILLQLNNWKHNALLLVVIYFVSPVIVFCMKPLLAPEIFLGLILASAMTSGLSVIFLAGLFGGTPQKALVVTVIANLLSPFIVPLLVYVFAERTIEVHLLRMAYTMGQLVLIPFILAFVVRRTPVARPLQRVASPISVVLLLCIIIGIIAPVRDDILAQPMLSLQVGSIVLFLIAINSWIGFLLGRNPAERITYSITAGYKNFTLATVLALTLFGPLVALPAIMYTIVDNLLLIPLGIATRRR